MISKRKIKIRLNKKTKPDLVETISLALSSEYWNPVVRSLSGPTKKLISINLSEIEKNSETGDILIVAGKILGKGKLTKKVKICGLAISKEAEEKLKETKSDFTFLKDEIKKNPKAEGVKIL